MQTSGTNILWSQDSFHLRDVETVIKFAIYVKLGLNPFCLIRNCKTMKTKNESRAKRLEKSEKRMDRIGANEWNIC